MHVPCQVPWTCGWAGRVWNKGLFRADLSGFYRNSRPKLAILTVSQAEAVYFAGIDRICHLKRRPAAHGGRQCAFVQVIELAADRHAVREPRHLYVGLVQQIGDVMGRALAIDRG